MGTIIWKVCTAAICPSNTPPLPEDVVNPYQKAIFLMSAVGLPLAILFMMAIDHARVAAVAAVTVVAVALLIYSLKTRTLPQNDADCIDGMECDSSYPLSRKN
jgi:hypothetical protein